MGQRVRNLQPLGGLMGLGTSPERMMRFFLTPGLAIGTADKVHRSRDEDVHKKNFQLTETQLFCLDT